MKPTASPELLTKLKQRYKHAKVAYYNGDPVMTDAEFDKLEDRIKKLDPKWSELKKTGVKVKAKKTEVQLQKFMPSLNKAYPEQLPKWLAKNGSEMMVMDKLDGSALLLGFTDGKPTSLVTRGDGVHGGDISFLIPHLNIPTLKKPLTVFMRCEAVMKKSAFAKRWASKYENPRNLVNGVLNRALDGEPSKELKDVHIVVLGVYGWPMLRGLTLAKNQGMRTVSYAILKGEGTSHYEARLDLRREHGDYEVDGLVLAAPDTKFDYTSADKPKHTIAFKVNDDAGAQVVTVEDIIWQVTAHSRIIPKIEIEPTRMDGVLVKHATVHNAKWMMDRNIGPGAQVKVLRSGGVIPKIVGVVKPGKFKAPDVDYVGKGVHFVTRNEDEATQQRITVLRIKKFITTLGIEFAADGTLTLALERLPTLRAWLRAWHERKLVVKLTAAGIGGVNARKIDAEFTRVLSGPIPAVKLLSALNVFDPGIGERKLQALLDGGMSIEYMVTDATEEEIANIKGFSTKTARLLLKGAQRFQALWPKVGPYFRIEWDPKPKKAKATGKLSGQYVSWTGYRSKEEEASVEAAGGEVVTFGAKTTILLYKDDGKASSKVEKARAKGIKVVTFNRLKL